MAVCVCVCVVHVCVYICVCMLAYLCAYRGGEGGRGSLVSPEGEKQRKSKHIQHDTVRVPTFSLPFASLWVRLGMHTCAHARTPMQICTNTHAHTHTHTHTHKQNIHPLPPPPAETAAHGAAGAGFSPAPPHAGPPFPPPPPAGPATSTTDHNKFNTHCVASSKSA